MALSRSYQAVRVITAWLSLTG